MDKKNTLLAKPTISLLQFLACIYLLLIPAMFIFKDTGYVVAKAIHWNIFLAATPLILCLPVVHFTSRGEKKAISVIFSILWLFCYPNAPYMLTDFIHLNTYTYGYGYNDAPKLIPWLWLLYLTASIAIGCLLGFISLYLMQGIVTKRYGSTKGWLFCGAVSLLSGIGIYIGRFIRFNTWDVFTRPLAIIFEIFSRINLHTLAFCLMFAVMAFVAYFLFHLCFAKK